MEYINKSVHKKNQVIISKSSWKKQGFLLQIASDKYILGAGPFLTSLTPNVHKGSFFCPSFFCTNEGVVEDCFYIPSAMAVFSKKELLNLFKNKDVHSNIFYNIWKEPCFLDFQEFFYLTKNQITLNNLKKVVPVFFETTDYLINLQDILILIYRLILYSKKGMAYAYWSDKQAIIGNTPEYLFQKEDKTVQTMALAGTARNTQHNLLKDLKEQQEHTLVVTDIKKKLKPLGVYSYSERYVYSIGNLQHLRTDFKVQLKQNISFKKLCYLLHPTPALGGYPQKEALNLLLQLDQKENKRHKYGAPFGVIIEDKYFCVVAIRNIQFFNNKAYLGSGCGLVKNSVLKREWQELKQKRQVIKDILF